MHRKEGRCPQCEEEHYVYENGVPFKEKETANLDEAVAATINDLRKAFENEIKEEKYEVSDDA